ncbi:MAG: redoxin domain-containing protein [Cyclonatronaceae bacterium]
MIPCHTYRLPVSKALILCVVFILVAADSSPAASRTGAPADTLIIPMEQVKGFGPFQPTSAFLRERDERSRWHPAEPLVQGAPENLTNFFYQVEKMDFVQHAWQSCVAGLIDCEMVREALKNRGVDTTRLTDSFVDTYVTVGTGIGDDGQRKVIIHSGGTIRRADGRAVIDLTGAEPLPLPDPSTGNPRRDRETMVVRPIRFQLFDGGEIINVTDWYRVSGPVPFGSMEDDRPVLVIGSYSHRQGQLSLPDRQIHFYLQNRFTTGAYTPESALLFSGPPRDGLQLQEDQLIQVGENVCLGNNPYRFDGVAADGSEIRLIHEPELVHKTGFRPGYHVPPLEAPAFKPDGQPEHISLCSMRGFLVYLFFWGTWCTSCVDELPYLTEAWRLFEATGDFRMIGVAYDSPETLENFLQDRNIGWPQILNEQKEQNPILDTWEIEGHPSTFFIDRKGIILKRQLNGYDLETELAREIGFDGPAGERLLEGDIVIRRTFPDAQNVTLEAGFSLPGRTPLYQLDGRWSRGFRAEPGDHRYRLYVDGEFTPDPDNPRTEVVDGKLFNVLTLEAPTEY